MAKLIAILLVCAVLLLAIPNVRIQVVFDGTDHPRPVQEACVPAKVAESHPQPPQVSRKVARATAAVTRGHHVRTKFRRTPASVRRASAADKLAAPADIHPSWMADLRDTDSVEFRWSPVDGAARYRVRAWELVEDQKVELVDQEVDATHVIATPSHRTRIQWQVQAIGRNGTAGEVSGPVTIGFSGVFR